MAQEIERRFLVLDTHFLAGCRGERILQGYVAKEAGAMTTRVRIRGERAFLTLKGPSIGIARDEYEYPIPLPDAREILARYCSGRVVEKTRHVVPFGRHAFEVDMFHGRHAGLVIAEVELMHAAQPVQCPPWLGPEITADKRFGNFALASSPLPVLGLVPPACVHRHAGAFPEAGRDGRH
ncbi:CYTH domain-containing protein [Rhodocyclaceae bacterium SMB388]